MSEAGSRSFASSPPLCQVFKKEQVFFLSICAAQEAQILLEQRSLELVWHPWSGHLH